MLLAECVSVGFVGSDFPEWEETMNSWGNKMLAAVEAVAELAALGFGLPADAFTSRMRLGPHLLAPTGDVGPALSQTMKASVCIA